LLQYWYKLPIKSDGNSFSVLK